MAADIPSSLNSWSSTAASCQPDNTDAVGPNILAENLRQIQAVMRANIAGSDTIASGATCDLGSKEANYLSVTGTTTITSFGSTGTAGIVKTLKFDGALTLTHNATSLILPGAANITTVAGDVGVFRCEGSGNWRCLSYVPTNQDPYIEGTWTPAFASTGSSFTPNAGSTYGSYIKVGSLVLYTGRIVLTSASLGSNLLEITGMPHTMLTTNGAAVGSAMFSSLSSSSIYQTSILAATGSSLYCYKSTASSNGFTTMVASDLATNASVNFEIIVRV